MYEESIWNLSHPHTHTLTHARVFFHEARCLCLCLCTLCHFWFAASASYFLSSVVHSVPIMRLQPVTSLSAPDKLDPATEEPRALALPSLNYRQITFPILPMTPRADISIRKSKEEGNDMRRKPEGRTETRGWRRVVRLECKENNEFNYPCKHTEDWAISICPSSCGLTEDNDPSYQTTAWSRTLEPHI